MLCVTGPHVALPMDRVTLNISQEVSYDGKRALGCISNVKPETCVVQYLLCSKDLANFYRSIVMVEMCNMLIKIEPLLTISNTTANNDIYC